MSKSFPVLEAITVKARSALEKPVTVSFREFASFIWLDDPAGYTDAQGKSPVVAQHRWHAVIAKFEVAEPGDWITLEDQDYAALKRVVEAPARRHTDSRITMACIPFSDAVLNAVDKIPEFFTAAAGDLTGPAKIS